MHEKKDSKKAITPEYAEPKRILVTGGAGFLGSHLCDRLLELGNEVLCVDNLFTGRKRNIYHLLDIAATGSAGVAGPTGVAILILIVLLTIPILDTLTAITRRTRRGLPIHFPDSNHFHHRLLRLAGSPRRTLLWAYVLNLCTAVAAVAYALIGGIAGLVVLLMLAGVVCIVFVVVFRLVRAEYVVPGATK